MTTEAALLIANCVLVLVTGWYAFLTLKLARSARDSAQAAQISAEASLRSMQVAQASLGVVFSINPVYRMRGVDDSIRFDGLILESVTANVFIHGLRLEAFGYMNAPTRAYGISEHMQELGENLELGNASPYVLRTGSHGLPILVHAGEAIEFDLPESTEMPDVETVSVLGATVFYSLDGISPPRGRFIQWFDPDSMNRR